MYYHKLFEELSQKEQNTVKFAFELVAKSTAYRCSLVKLNANGTTGYPVYYFYMCKNGQGYVLRIIKQGRKCKLMPFGNPKIIWTFVNDPTAKIPTRKEATVECFTQIFKQDTIRAKGIINWINNNIQSNITLQDFGISSTSTSSYSSTPSKGQTTTSTTVKKNDPEKKKALITKLLKLDIAKAKNSKHDYERSYITIDVSDFYVNHKDELLKCYDKDFWYDDLENDFYSLGIYKLEIPGYIKDCQISRPSGWLRDERPTHITQINYIAKQCKEFDSLNKYITSVLKCKALDINDIKRQNVAGKRSKIFDTYNVILLAHEPEKCKNIKTALQKMKKSNWSACIELKTDMYWGDRFNSYGEDRECEWDGLETKYALVTFTTPSGKKVGKYEIRP